MLQDPQGRGSNLGAAALPRSSASLGDEGEPQRAGAVRDGAAAGLEALAAGGGIISHPRVSPDGLCCAGGWRRAPPRSRAVRKRMLRSHRPTEHSGPAAGQGSTGVPQPPPWGHLLPPCCLAPQSPCGGRGGSGGSGSGGQRERGQACERSAPAAP